MTTHRPFTVPLGNGALTLGAQPVIMGILNVTPDSFSDGGDHPGPDAALIYARALITGGAHIIDVGGESTRPGADETGTQDELDRVIPVIAALKADGIRAPVSIDTYKAVVADQAIQTGAAMINDVGGLQRQPEIADIAALYEVPVVAMHWDPDRDTGRDLITEIARWFDKTLNIARKAGITENRIILDPGFGFAKDLAENYELLRRLDELHALGFPLVVGTSRKSMLGKLLDVPPRERAAATVATSVMAYERGAHIFRVHDVRPNRDGLCIAAATLSGPPKMGE